MYSYLKNKKQKVQISNTISNFKEVIVGFPQGFIDAGLPHCDKIIKCHKNLKFRVFAIKKS